MIVSLDLSVPVLKLGPEVSLRGGPHLSTCPITLSKHLSQVLVQQMQVLLLECLRALLEVLCVRFWLLVL